MSQDPSEGLKPAELRPAMQPPETESASTSSEQSGTYYSPPLGYAPPAAPAAEPVWRMAALGVAVAAAVTAGVWYAMTPPAPPVVVPAATTSVKVDQPAPVPNGAADVKATAYLKAVLGAKTAETSRGDLTAASASTSTDGGQLQAANAAALMAIAQTAPDIAKDILAGKRLLYPVRLGDVVEADIYHADIYVDGANMGDINHGGGVILVPLIPGEPSQLKVVPTADRGGRGVTVGLILPSGELWRTGIMQVGESEQRQITIR